MKRLLAASLGVAVLAWGADALAAPKMLSETQLDKVVAGSVPDNGNFEDHAASGGAIIGAGSEASFNTEGHVGASGNTQQDAAAVNIVNAAESLVGNGVNVWSDSVDSISADGLFDANAYVTQNNEINQDASKVAHVGFWEHKDLSLELSASANSELATSVETSGWAIGAAGIIDLSLGGVNTESLGGGFHFFAEGSVCASGDGSCAAQLSDTYSTEASLKLDFTKSTLENASAEYITGDDVKLDVNSVNTVCITDNAQQGATAVNIVNAASSLVANGVNVASTGTIYAFSVDSYANAYLTQNNSIYQRR